MTTTVLAATAAGRALARALASHLGGDIGGGDLKRDLADAWTRSHTIVLVMATGAAVRLIAPHLAAKHTDPGVVAVDDTGTFAVALAGGHEGGANELAERVAAFLGATPVVTTASERHAVPSVGALGAAWGARAEGDVAAVGGALVSSRAVYLLREVRAPLEPLGGDVTEVDDVADVPTDAPLVWVTDRLAERPGPTVLVRPPSLVVGVGSSRGVTADEVGALVDEVLCDAGLSPRSVTLVATVDAKADEDGILAAADARGWPVVTLAADHLAATAVPNPSKVVRAAVGTPSVCEAAALHLGGQLLVEKTRSAMATVAVARRPVRGHLALVSLGPGDPGLVPPLARDALRAAEVVVGYGPYVDQAAAFTRRGAVLERFPLGDEIRRAERSLELARQGRAVALVGSGDVGVYAMASPTLALADGEVDVTVVPGITAALAASALLGAPFGHDHCSISLSDLLTPWERIRGRVRAAAEADLAVAFYNPRSRGRDWQLAEAIAVLRAHRPDDTPVGVVRDAFRPGQQVTITTLAALDVRQVQMTTVVLVGTSRSAVRHGRIVTPRGYREVTA
jgi:cobalt-precorrin 5A hydrolase/precorrin-3B C17-methyltransferase